MPPMLEGICFPEKLRLLFSPEVLRKHSREAVFLAKKGIGVEWHKLGWSRHRTRLGELPDRVQELPGRVWKLPDRFREFSGRAGSKPAEDRAGSLLLHPSLGFFYVRKE